MKKSFFPFLFAFLFCLTGYSQVTLSVDSVTDLNVPDSVNYASSSGFTVVVNISGPTPFTGDVNLLMGVDSSAGVLSVDTVTRSVVNKMNDTINFVVTETYDILNGYRKGGNVVVIWPVASTLSTLDTMYTNVFVRSAVGINESSELYRQFSVYPNPVENYILIKNYGINNKIEQVRIFDASGKTVFNEKYSSKIDVSSFEKGLYFMNLYLRKGEELHYKLVKY